MWFAEQLDSFLNLGICKEYPNMARSRSTSGGKTNRPGTSTSKDQTSTSNPVNLPDVKAAAAETAPAAIVPETKSAPETRKFEVRKPAPHKAEPRKNVVPINLEDEIRRRAYELYERRVNSGNETEDWLTAEREVLQRYHQQSA
jgi:hypothetical protein